MIVKRLKATIGHHINIMDEKGMVIASSDEERVNTIHTGAIEVLQSKKERIIEEQLPLLPGTRPGVNLPIEFLDEIIGVVGITGNPKELLQLAQMTKITVELIIQQDYLKKHAFFEQQLMHSWIMELISTNDLNEEKLTKEAKHFLQIDLKIAYTVLVLEVFTLSSINDDLWAINEKKEAILSALPLTKMDISFASFTNEELLVVGIPSDELSVANDFYRLLKGLNAKLFSTLKIGVGNSKIGLIGIRESYKEARQCVHLMNKFSTDKTISQIQSWGLIRLLDEIKPSVREEFLAQYQVGNLPLHLRETLEALIENNHNINDTSKKLHIHRNTLHYRLENIEQLTGLHPKTMNGLALLHILLIFDKLRETF